MSHTPSHRQKHLFNKDGTTPKKDLLIANLRQALLKKLQKYQQAKTSLPNGIELRPMSYEELKSQFMQVASQSLINTPS